MCPPEDVGCHTIIKKPVCISFYFQVAKSIKTKYNFKQKDLPDQKNSRLLQFITYDSVQTYLPYISSESYMVLSLLIRIIIVCLESRYDLFSPIDAVI